MSGVCPSLPAAPGPFIDLPLQLLPQGVPPIDATVAVTGPIASCVADTALMYALMAGTGQRPGVQQPRVLLPASGSASGDKPLAGKRAGVCWQVRGVLAGSPGQLWAHVCACPSCCMHPLASSAVLPTPPTHPSTPAVV